jgi:hypothetical protein
MMTTGQLNRYIDRTYILGGGDVGCCKKIVITLLNEDRQFYTYGDFLNSANAGSDKRYDIHDIQQAIDVLKGGHVQLLHEVYRYIDDDVIYDLSLEELQIASVDGVLDLELRGYPDRDFKSKVYVIFSADRTVVSDEPNN